MQSLGRHYHLSMDTFYRKVAFNVSRNKYSSHSKIVWSVKYCKMVFFIIETRCKLKVEQCVKECAYVHFATTTTFDELSKNIVCLCLKFQAKYFVSVRPEVNNVNCSVSASLCHCSKMDLGTVSLSLIK